MAESSLVLWFGRADRPWSEAALARLLSVARVQLVPGLDAATAPADTLPEVADWLVLEEHRPGQITWPQLQPLLRKFPLAGLVVLQGPWSAASYPRPGFEPPAVLFVAWHTWPWFVRRLQQPPAAPSSGEDFSGPLVPLLGTCRPQGAASRQAFSPPAGGPPCGDCWVLTGDAELGRMLAEELHSLGAAVRRLPPHVLRPTLSIAPGCPPEIVFWELGAWLPGRPRREIQQLACRLRPRRLVVLGAQQWPDLPGQLQVFSVETLWLPLPIPDGALPRLVAVERNQAA